MASLLVLVAHSGRTLQLDVQPSTRVDAVQHALVSFTGIPVADQIAMYQGARLDPTKLLGAYRLPVDPAAANPEDHPVFLYCRSYLKPGAALPPPEALPPLQVQVPPLAEVNLTHPLHSAPSPLVRALPDYERHFQHHLATTRAYWEVAQARLQRCRQLLSEQEVQARAADAARANVEAHYNYILNSYQTFLDKYNAQHAAHALLLSTFPADLAALESIELHPALQQPSPQQQLAEQADAAATPGEAAAAHQAHGQEATATGSAAPAPPRRLSDLYPMQRLREWAETCGRSHASFAAKVAELEALFQLLRKDVEGLFMQAPSVDLDALGRQMAESEALLDEHSSMVQVLSKDLRTVRALVEDVVRQLGSAGAGGGGGGLRQGGLHDAAAAMEAIHETHRNRVLPRLASLDGQLAAFAASVESSKVAMSRDVLGQLQRISGQQSRIRDMKNKLAAFHEVLGRQDAAFGELKVVHRLPSAYRALLAEVVRRSAWHQLYCGQAGRLAEHMLRFREKEEGRRSAFLAQVARYIPADLLARAGLSTGPPHCQVTVPPPDVPLISVAMADLQRLSYLDERLLAASASLRASTSAAATAGRAAAAASASHHHHHRSQVSALASAGPAASQHHHQQHHHHHQRHPAGASHQASGAAALSRGLSVGPGLPGGGAASAMPFPGTVAVLDAEPPPPADPVNALEMENARLRAELANHIAAACLRELNATTTTTSETGSQQQPQQHQLQQAPTAEAAAGPRASGGGAAASAVGSSLPASVATAAAGTVAGAPPSAAPAAASATAAAQPSASASASSRRDPAELVAAMHRALGMKDDLIRQQQREASALAARLATYEERIAALEALLDARAIAEGAAAAAASDAAAAAAGRPVEGSGGVNDGDAGASRQPDSLEAATQHGTCSAGASAPAEGCRPVDEGGQAQEGRGAAASTGAVPEEQGEGQAHGGGTAAMVEPGGQDAGGATAPEGAPAGESGKPAAAARPPSALTLRVASEASAAAGAEDGDAGPSPAAPAVVSPFSFEAAQQQRAESGGERDLSGVGVSATPAITLSSTLPDATATGVVVEVGASGSACLHPPEAATAAVRPLRGSSGPQAIPQPSARTGGGNDGQASGPAGEAAGASRGTDGGLLAPFPSRGPTAMMSIGSLPFATSLPVGSALTGRLASSPSGGIGLGLALGFGLVALPEGQAGGEAEGQQQQQQRKRRGSGRQAAAGAGMGAGGSSSSSGGGSRSRSGQSSGSDGGRAGGNEQRAEQRGNRLELGTLTGGDGADDESLSGSSARSSLSGGSGSSSGGLQFQPSWSAPVSGESAGGAEDGAGQSPRMRQSAGGGAAAGDAEDGAGGADGGSLQRRECGVAADQPHVGEFEVTLAAAATATAAAGASAGAVPGVALDQAGIASAAGAADSAAIHHSVDVSGSGGGEEASRLQQEGAEDQSPGRSGDGSTGTIDTSVAEASSAAGARVAAADGSTQSGTFSDNDENGKDADEGAPAPAVSASGVESGDDVKGSGEEEGAGDSDDVEETDDQRDGNEDDDDDDDAVEKLPDIDDVIEDTDGAWEVTPLHTELEEVPPEAALAAVRGPTPAAPGSGEIAVRPASSDLSSDGSSSRLLGAGAGLLGSGQRGGDSREGPQTGERQASLEESSGYETVGSVGSAAGEMGS